MFHKKHAVKRTIWNFFIYLHNWKLGCPCCALLCTNSNSGGEENYFHIINQAFQFYCEGLLEILRCGSSSLFPSILFFQPISSSWHLFCILFQLKQGFYSYNHQFLSSAAFSVLQLLLRALTPNWQSKLTQSTISQVSLSYATHSSSQQRYARTCACGLQVTTASPMTQLCLNHMEIL